MKHYTVVKHGDSEILERKVNENIKMGYEPFGSLQVLAFSYPDGSSTRLFLQPMIKEMAEEKWQ